MSTRIAIAGLVIFLFQFGFAQNKKEFKVWNPATDTIQVLQGQAWSGQVKDFYDRLPARAEQSVIKEIWNLSKNSAGLKLRFTIIALCLLIY